MDVTFLYPVAAWLFVLLPLVWWTARRRRDRGHVALRLAVFACLILALMQPSLIRRAGAGGQVFVIDQRAVLGAEGRAAARAALARVLAAAPRGGQRTLIQLEGDPVAAAVDARERLAGKSLSAALARALDALPLGLDASVTLIADPRSTDRHWERSVAALVRRGIAVNTIALHGPTPPAFIADVSVAPARVGESVAVTVEVEGDGAGHVVTLWSGDRQLAASAPFAADGPTRIALAFPSERTGFVPLRATLDGRGGVEAVAAVQEPLRLLYLGERQVGAAARLQRLLGRGFAVEQRPAAALADPARWPLLFVDDLPAARFPAAAQRRAMAAVARAGTGLIASGGEAAFGSGGYAAAPLAAALPVTAKQDERVETPSVALAIVIDSSGSMAGAPLDLARQIARQTVRQLTPADSVGVVEFYGAKQWAVPMQRARDTASVERAIGRMQAQGASMLFPALQEAYYGLKDVDARYRHILVISDGGVAEDRYQQLLRHIADDRITVSTAVVGSDTSGEESMAEWARLGRGRFYSVPDEFSLVELDFKQPQIKPDPGYRAGAYPVRVAPGGAGWQGTTTAVPPLAGYARVAARPEAQTLLTTAGGDPVLSSWNYGSGRVTALATEPLGEGTAAWQRWPGYGAWLARIAAMTARQRPALDVTLTRRFDRLTIAAQRLDSSGAADAAPVVRLRDGAGRRDAAVPVEQRAPGLFVADVAWTGGQPALVEVRDGDAVVRAADRAFSDRSPPEAMPVDRGLPLAALSARTHGWHRDDPAAAPGPIAPGGGRVASDVWPWLSLLALVFYLAEIGYRRWPPRNQ